MRLVATLDQPEQARLFSLFLDEKGIDNKVESTSENQHLIWVLNEDKINDALKGRDEFLSNPDWKPSAVTLQKEREKELQEEALKAFAPNSEEGTISSEEESLEQKPPLKKPAPILRPMGRLTLAVIAACVVLFFWGTKTAPAKIEMPEQEYEANLLFYTPYKQLSYEQPLAFQYFEEFLNSVQSAPDPQGYLTTSKAYEQLYRFRTTPYWHGFYETHFVPQSSKGNSLNKALSSSPQFEQIAQGEIWRIFTPMLLHASLLHIIFNLIWFAILGKQIEQRVGFWRFLFIILVVGGVSNTAQYLMSGANFLGLSGVIMGLAGFIWMRQTKAAWEGYSIQKATLYFLACYVLLLLALQAVSLVLEWTGSNAIAPNIANTAHVVGGLVGLLLGCCNFLSAWDLGKINK